MKRMIFLLSCLAIFMLGFAGNNADPPLTEVDLPCLQIDQPVSASLDVAALILYDVPCSHPEVVYIGNPSNFVARGFDYLYVKDVAIPPDLRQHGLFNTNYLANHFTPNSENLYNPSSNLRYHSWQLVKEKTLLWPLHFV